MLQSDFCIKMLRITPTNASLIYVAEVDEIDIKWDSWTSKAANNNVPLYIKAM